MHSSVGPTGMQFALVPFNTYANVELYLNQASSYADVQRAVQNMHYLPGLTNTFEYASYISAATAASSRTSFALVFISAPWRRFAAMCFPLSVAVALIIPQLSSWLLMERKCTIHIAYRMCAWISLTNNILYLRKGF